MLNVGDRNGSVGSAGYGTGLTADTAYEVVIVALSPNLDSIERASSPRLAVRTLPRTAPSSVSAVAVGPTSVKVTWVHDGDGVNEFRVQKKNSSGDWVLAKGGINRNTKVFTLTNQHTKLIPGRTYEFREVADYNAENKHSTPDSATLPDATGPRNVRVPAATIRRRGAIVEWDAPSPEWDIGSYRVEVRRVSNNNLVVSNGAGANLSFDITRLKAGVEYKVKIVA